MAHDHSSAGHSHAGHGHDHDHGHEHTHHAETGDRGRVFWAMVVTLSFMGVEIVGGVLSGSLALLADAAHMATDAGALALAWFGFRIAERPADAKRSYGFARFRILAAFVNGFSLVLLAGWIVVEAIHRIADPAPVTAGVMMWVAVGGLIANLVAFAILHGGDRENLNLSGALWHVAGDLLGSVAAILAALVILLTGWTLADPILSVLIAGLVAVAGWNIMRKSAHILLEGAPAGFDEDTLGEDLTAHVPGLASIHHVHAWLLTERQPLITLHAVALDGTDPLAVRNAIKARLKARFGVWHATVEMEPREGACEDGDCEDCASA